MTCSKGTYPGINIQYPISQLILDGTKTVETRTYPIPAKYEGLEMAIVETPGKDGNFKARIVGIVIFGRSFAYASEYEFYRDVGRHCVTPESPWKWEDSKPKWGWPIEKVYRFEKAVVAPESRGIQFTKSISI